MPYSRTKTSHSPTRLQVFIDRLRFVLGVVAIIAIAVTFVLGQQENRDQNARLKKVESPCLRYGPKSKECHAAFGAAIKRITPYQLCILLARQPELTGVKPASCVRIAKEAKEKAESRQAAARSALRSGDGSSAGPQSGNQTVAHNAPKGNGTSGGGGSGHHPAQPGGGPGSPSPQPPGSPSPSPRGRPPHRLPPRIHQEGREVNRQTLLRNLHLVFLQSSSK